jgi:hypothetical protein
MKNLGEIEVGIRAQLQSHVSPQLGFFYHRNYRHKCRIPPHHKSILGNLPLSQKQGQALGVEVGKQISPYLELCCLRISANVSYANAEADLAMLTGMGVSDNTQQRLVQTSHFPDPLAEQPIA